MCSIVRCHLPPTTAPLTLVPDNSGLLYFGAIGANGKRIMLAGRGTWRGRCFFGGVSPSIDFCSPPPPLQTIFFYPVQPMGGNIQPQVRARKKRRETRGGGQAGGASEIRPWKIIILPLPTPPPPPPRVFIAHHRRPRGQQRAAARRQLRPRAQTHRADAHRVHAQEEERGRHRDRPDRPDGAGRHGRAQEAGVRGARSLSLFCVVFCALGVRSFFVVSCAARQPGGWEKTASCA